MNPQARSPIRRLHVPVLVATFVLLASQAQAQPSREPGSRLPVRVVGDRVLWPVPAERVLVRIHGPEDRQIQAVFEAGDAPSLSIADLAEDRAIRDGTYKLSLRRLETSDPSGKAPPVRFDLVRVVGGLARVAPEATPSAGAESGGMNVKRSALVVDQASTPFVWLEDTTAEGSGTETDWVMAVDLLEQGDGDSDLVLYSFDQSSGSATNYRHPLVIENGSPDNSLYVADVTGNLGLGTNAPVRGLHLARNPVIRFDGGSGTRPWELEGSSGGFWLHDDVANTFPFVVREGVPDDMLRLAPNGVGVRTSSPQGDLHIYGEATADAFSGIGPDLINGPAFNFGYSGSSFGVGSGFFNVRPSSSAVAPNPALYFATRNVERMMIDRDGDIAVDMDNSFQNTFDPQHPLHAQRSGAHLSSGGVWTNASSRALKENVEPLTLEAARAALRALEPVLYNYRAVPDDPQVGFIAEDVPELVATPDRATLAHGEIVGVLTKVLQAQQDQIEALQQRLQLLEATRPDPWRKR